MEGPLTALLSSYQVVCADDYQHEGLQSSPGIAQHLLGSVINAKILKMIEARMANIIIHSSQKWIL